MSGQRLELTPPALSCRLLVAMVTPFDERLRVDPDAAGELARQIVQDGADGVVVADLIGEGPSLTDDERLELVAGVRKALAGDAVVVVAAADADTERTLDLARRALGAGADAVACPGPGYGFLGHDAIDRHFRALGERAGGSVIMHSAPARTGTALRPATAFVNAHVPDIAGFWDASGDLEGLAAVGVQCRRSPHGRPRLWAGDEFFLLPGLAAGAYGLVSALAQVAGPAVRDLLNAWLAGDMELAGRLQVGLVPLIQVLDLVRGDPAPIKTVLEPLGVVGRRHRAPVTALTPARAEAVRSAVREAAAQLGSAAPC